MSNANKMQVTTCLLGKRDTRIHILRKFKITNQQLHHDLLPAWRGAKENAYFQ